MIKEFRLPDAGEGLTEAQIVSWRVRPGDTVQVNDVIVEIETAKSLVELPCPFAGVVSRLLVPEGATVDVGTPLIAVETDASASSSPSGAVLVGYGPRTASVTRRPRRSSPPVLAKPPVRKLARDLGVDLVAVAPSGTGGVVTREDVEAAASAAVATVPLAQAQARETRTPITGVRRLTAEAIVASAFTAPHVTVWVQVDVTRSMRLLDRLRADPEFEGVKVSPLLVVARALLIAVQRTPGVNATFDAAGGEIVVKHYVNLGIAAATPRGLVVPNVKDADRLTLRELAHALSALTATARAGRTPPADLTGGTITITNVGVFGVDAGTPIINPGESAIVCLGQVRQLPWVHKGTVRPRWVTQLAVSFDHRLVDGDLGSRFLSDIAAVLEHPSQALAWL